ncbi:MAG: DsbA family protein [Pelagimonas sp.]|uniref:DsbA family protein n=1 Tax=Pelagimonas sp. TaxID=2073170 RepID=UPI003D6BABF8
MTQTVTLQYLFDPLCGWCYGASGSIKALAKHPAIDLQPMATGLFAGTGARPMKSFAAQAWAMDQRIGALSGQPFSEDYRTKVLGAEDALLDSTVATRAVTAVSASAPDRVIDALVAIQSARYYGGKDVTSAPVVAGLLTDLGLTEASARLVALDEALLQQVTTQTNAARDVMNAYGLQGVPSLIATINGELSILDASALYSGPDAILAALKLA